jgi:simple sugar transport system substrate-binding protein
MKNIFVKAVLFCTAIFIVSCSAESSSAGKTRALAVFVPGMTAGSPIYEQLVSGVQLAAAEYEDASVKVIEGGFNQAEWEDKINILASGGKYDLIVTSNPAMPELCARVAARFPQQKFFIADGFLEGGRNIATVLYNQIEQGYIAGYLAGLYTAEQASGKAGMIIAQDYPAMEKMIKPGFKKGLEAADKNINLDVRVIGNWYDAGKAYELAKAMYLSGVEVILPIAGGAAAGVFNAARELNKKVVYFDGNGYALSPETVIGCSILRQEELVYTKVKDALDGKLKYGKAEIVGVKEGRVDFYDDHEVFQTRVPEKIRKKLMEQVEKLRNGVMGFELKGL